MPTIIEIVSGVDIIAFNKKIIPVKKSIQLAKSFNIPNEDFIKKMTPNKSSNWNGKLKSIAKSKIIPAIISIIPSPLTSMFFKPYIPF